MAIGKVHVLSVSKNRQSGVLPIVSESLGTSREVGTIGVPHYNDYRQSEPGSLPVPPNLPRSHAPQSPYDTHRRELLRGGCFGLLMVVCVWRCRGWRERRAGPAPTTGVDQRLR